MLMSGNWTCGTGCLAGQCFSGGCHWDSRGQVHNPSWTSSLVSQRQTGHVDVVVHFVQCQFVLWSGNWSCFGRLSFGTGVCLWGGAG